MLMVSDLTRYASPLTKLEELKLLLTEVPEGRFIYTLSETFLNSDTDDSLIAATGYDVFRKDRSKSLGRSKK